MARKNAHRDAWWQLPPQYGFWFNFVLTSLVVALVATLSILGLARFPLALACLLGGALIEGRRLAGNWSTIFMAVGIALFFSMGAFISKKGLHDTSFEGRLQAWPYYFIGSLVVFLFLFLIEKTFPKISEGFVLLQSIAYFYWASEKGLWFSSDIWLKSLAIAGGLFGFYAVRHAFSYDYLNKSRRFRLSLWSAALMLLLAADNIWQAFIKAEPMEYASEWANRLSVAGQFFFLGTSSIYILHGAIMFFGFVPMAFRFFSSTYRSDLRDMRDSHIERFSDQQVNVKQSVFCLFFAGSFFAANYVWRFIPANFAIWASFAVFPFIVEVAARIGGKSWRSTKR